MQDYFEFANNVRIIAGKRSINQLPEVLARHGGYRVFIVSDEVIKKAGHVDRVIKAINLKKELTIGDIYLNAKSTPTVQDVTDMYIAFRKSGADAIVGIGGTRVMNATKALYLLIATQSKDITDFRGIDAAIRINDAPCVLVPTSFGSGGEVSKEVIVIDEENSLPIEITTGALQPQYCILDPDSLKTLPEKEIYMSLIDMYGFCIESYISKKANDLTKSFAKMALFLIKDNFQKAIMDKDDDALCNMQRAAVIAAIAYSNSKTGLAHAIANALAAKYQIHRGEAVCCVLVNALNDLKDVCQKELSEMLLFSRGSKEFANVTDVERAEIFLDVVKNVVNHLDTHFNVKTHLKDYGINEEDLDAIAELTLQDGELIVSPKQYTKEGVLEILRKSL